jgi:hypothetical protein
MKPRLAGYGGYGDATTCYDTPSGPSPGPSDPETLPKHSALGGMLRDAPAPFTSKFLNVSCNLPFQGIQCIQKFFPKQLQLTNFRDI